MGFKEQKEKRRQEYIKPIYTINNRHPITREQLDSKIEEEDLFYEVEK